MRNSLVGNMSVEFVMEKDIMDKMKEQQAKLQEEERRAARRLYEEEDEDDCDDEDLKEMLKK